jgi:hypothetical protein
LRLAEDVVEIDNLVFSPVSHEDEKGPRSALHSILNQSPHTTIHLLAGHLGMQPAARASECEQVIRNGHKGRCDVLQHHSRPEFFTCDGEETGFVGVVFTHTITTRRNFRLFLVLLLPLASSHHGALDAIIGYAEFLHILPSVSFRRILVSLASLSLPFPQKHSALLPIALTTLPCFSSPAATQGSQAVYPKG